MPVTSRSVHSRAPVAYEYVPFYVGTITTSATNVVRVRLDRDAILHQVQLSASAVSGTSPTLSATVRRGATDLVTTPNLTAAGVVTASPTADNRVVRAGDVLEVNLTAGGTSPSYSNTCVVLVLRTGGPEFVGNVAL